MPRPEPPPEVISGLNRVAYAIAKEIAGRAVRDDPRLRRLDGLGAASAVHTMAKRMIAELQAEAAAAMGVCRTLIAEETEKPPEETQNGHDTERPAAAAEGRREKSA